MFCIFCMFCISMFSWILVRFLDHSRNAFCLCSWLSAQLFNCLGTLLLKTAKVGLPRWSSGSDAQAFNARGAGSVPGWGNKIPHAAWCSQKKKKNPAWAQWPHALLPGFPSTSLQYFVAPGTEMFCLHVLLWQELREFCLGECSLNWFPPTTLLLLLLFPSTHFPSILTEEIKDTERASKG